MKPINDVSADVIDAAIQIHKGLGPGLLESVYEQVLEARLMRMGYAVDRQMPVDIVYDDIVLKRAFRVDLLVDGRLVLEIKSAEQISRATGKQLLTYLRLLNQPVGLILNFSAATMKEGIRRVVNNYDPSR